MNCVSTNGGIKNNSSDSAGGMPIRLYALDLLRMAAALSVFFYHTTFIGVLIKNWPQNLMIDASYYGDFGVDLFFVISGYVITMSSENKTASNFIRSRFIRIYPAFIACSIITLLFDIALPLTDASERITTWAMSLTLFPPVIGGTFLSSVYWTLSVEITFYIMVAFLILTKIWGPKRREFVILWLLIALINTYAINIGVTKNIISAIFQTDFAGHFVAGIILYDIKTRKKIDLLDAIALAICWALITTQVIRHNIYISDINMIGNFSVSKYKLIFVAPIIITLVWLAANIKYVPSRKGIVIKIGLMSYPFYLLSSDFSFFICVIFERNWLGLWTYKDTVTHDIRLGIALFGSLLLSFLVVRYLEPILRSRLAAMLYPAALTSSPP